MLRHLLIAATMAVSAPATASQLYLFTQYGTNARGFVSDGLISETARIDFGRAPICVGTPDCRFGINDSGQGNTADIDLYPAYFQPGAFSNQGVYSSISSVIPTTLSVIALPDQFASASPVPEPATWAMMLVGFGGMGIALRRRRNVTTAART